MKKVIINLLATIGAIAIILAIIASILYFGSENELDYKIDRSIPSPANSYKATIYTIMSTWCSHVVAVNTETEQFSLESEKKLLMSKQVFSANCSAKLKVQWLSETTLLINIAPGNKSKWLNLNMAQTDKSGGVQIEYEFAPNKAD